MKNKQLVFGLVLLVLAVLAWSLGYTELEYLEEQPNVRIYPAAFFTLCGLVLLARSAWARLNRG